MISSNAFARTALETLNQHAVPYRRGGNTLQGMDSAGFIVYCLRQNGVNVSYSGTNDLYRNGGTRCIPLQKALKDNLVVPGVLLLHIEHDGQEPAKYRADGKGNCDFALIAVSAREGIYPSASKQKLISTKIEPVRGKANYVMFSKYIDYGSSSSSAPVSPTTPPSPPAASDGVFTTSGLKLRDAPSLRGGVIANMPRGTRVDLIAYGPEWCHVKYTVRPGLYHKGWCSSKFLTLD